MSVETIIAKIEQDTNKKVEDIIHDAQNQAESLKKQKKQVSDNETSELLTQAKQESHQQKQIKIAQAHQEKKRKIMAAREKLIDTCFTKAQEKLHHLSEKQYTKIITHLLKDGKKKLGEDFTVYISQKQDKHIAKKLGLTVSGSLEATGGVILKSKDKTITLDNTFEGILRRKKDVIRIKIGKLLFSTQKE